jgi:NAD(P)H-dependent FMN reductase
MGPGVNSVKVLGVSGSLRSASLHAALLRAIAGRTWPGIAITLYDEVGALPLFNPDLEPMAPPAVRWLWGAVDAHDALLIASPEYAHGVSAAIKNVLDWLVGYAPFYTKPVLVLNGTPRSHHADDALRETLRTMSATLVDDASPIIPLVGFAAKPAELADAPWMPTVIAPALERLRSAVEERMTPTATSSRKLPAASL